MTTITQPQALLDAVVGQRNAALNELASAQAAIVGLEAERQRLTRRVAELEPKVDEPPAADPSPPAP